MQRKFTFLGTGTSVGVPVLGCACEVCRSSNPRNHRYRSSVLVDVPGGRILIDTSPEMRLQLLRAGVSYVDAVLYTHFHADHLFGLDDVRLFSHYTGSPVPLYCSAETEGVIRQAFSYAFHTPDGLHPGALPQLVFHRVTDEPFTIMGDEVQPVPLVHSRFAVYGYRFGPLAYCTDVSKIPDSSWPLLQDLEVLVLDCLRIKPHPAHLSLDEALGIIERLRPRQAYLTHMGHEFDYDDLNPRLPAGVQMAYDGLSFAF